jgi:hypothetical protein
VIVVAPAPPAFTATVLPVIVLVALITENVAVPVNVGDAVFALVAGLNVLAVHTAELFTRNSEQVQSILPPS